WYHGDALVIRVDHTPPDVQWHDGVYGMRIEYVDGTLYLTPYESTRVCECPQCAPPAVDPIIVHPAPVVYAPRYTTVYYDSYDPYDVYWYDPPRSTLFVGAGLHSSR